MSKVKMVQIAILTEDVTTLRFTLFALDDKGRLWSQPIRENTEWYEVNLPDEPKDESWEKTE
jgi:hypothetical protein